MLEQATVTATVAVKDINAAKEFYGGTLGLKQTDENPGGVTYGSGANQLFVYPSASADTNQATYAAWSVSDIAAAVSELKSKGIAFERYEGMPGTWEGDVLVIEGTKNAWFKDPEGNILALESH